MLRKMKKIKLSNKVTKALRGSSKGVTLIELLIALALFGIIAIAFAGGLNTASRAVLTADVRTNAESLARTQMESIKSQEYNDELVDGEATYDKIPPNKIPNGYDICSVGIDDGDPENCSNDEDIIAVPWDSEENEPANEDNGLQRVKLVIKHDGRIVTTLVGYKVDRK